MHAAGLLHRLDVGRLGFVLCCLTVGLVLTGAEPSPKSGQVFEFESKIRPIVSTYCLSCHSTKTEKGGLDLEQFRSLADVRRKSSIWERVGQQVEAGEMPPKGKPQPSDTEKQALVTWIRNFLQAEAAARRNDPGPAPLRRLSHTEYDLTIRDLTGVDLRPAREFPKDGAAGEGFTNAAEALTDISTELFAKYWNAAKSIAEHAVLLPDGFRFSASKTRRDWTDEGTAALRQFYAQWATQDGRLDFQPYLRATVVHREALQQGRFAEIARQERLHPKYLEIQWKFWNHPHHNDFLADLQNDWRRATAADVAGLAARIEELRAVLWRTVKVGNYVQAAWNSSSGYIESLARQVPVDPPAHQTVTLRISAKPVPGQNDVLVFLQALETGKSGSVVWSRPRFEGQGKSTLLLYEYPKFGPDFEVLYPALFARASEYLSAAFDVHHLGSTADDIARQRQLNPAWLKRWIDLLALVPKHPEMVDEQLGPTNPAAAFHLLDEQVRLDASRPHLTGWRKRGEELPSLIANSAKWGENVPGHIPAHGIGVHPTPREFVGVAWQSPVRANVEIFGLVQHAHPACGNGVAWELEHRRGQRAALVTQAHVNLGAESTIPATRRQVHPNDVLLLRIEAKEGNHFCDMTAIDLTIRELDGAKREWNLRQDCAANVLDGNPHADRHGHREVWSFVRGASRSTNRGQDGLIPAESVLGRWLDVAADPKRTLEAQQLARTVEKLLSGPPPADEKSPDRLLWETLVNPESPLFRGLDVAAWGHRLNGPWSLPQEKFGQPDRASFTTSTNEATAIRLPASLFRGRDFVVDVRLPEPGDHLVRVYAGTSPFRAENIWKLPVLADATQLSYRQFVAAAAEFRQVFPLYVCFPQVVPTDEVVTLKMFHREDEPLIRLFLDDEQTQRLDRLWRHHRFVSRQPVAEYEYLPQFIGYTTQDTPKEFQQFFINRMPLFRKQAEEFLAEEERAIPLQLEALWRFAERAYRRPLQPTERTDLRRLYDSIRQAGGSHDEAFRGVLARLFVSPAFLYRIEQPPAGIEPRPLNDWELATRLSYFLWSSLPDEPLLQAAAAGRLQDPREILAQTRRMIQHPRTRALAIHFGTQWIHVRDFDEFNEKNEQLFPTFHKELRQALYEEAILFFLDFFQGNRPITSLIDADHTFVNGLLAEHYGIPSVHGPAWQRVEGVRRYGRGGILTLGSVLAKQSGASRTSPVLRGNWIVETLLGEKLPKPPPNVPQLPETEGNDQLTMRQLVERHAADPACATCHVRIDPLGFALERYDAIGRWRDKDLGGLPIDTRTKLRDGTELEGIDGLRQYLLGPKRDTFVRLFCQRLLGYALGRSVLLSDRALVDDMVAALQRQDGRIMAAIETIVVSPQFRMIRGRDHSDD
jgi:hypothetical protein